MSWKLILQAMGEEGAERFFHSQMSEWMREEMAKGADARSTAINLILRLRDNAILQKAKELLGENLAGAALTAVGAGFAEKIRELDWESILPEDQGHIMREVRLLLQVGLPSILIGGFDGISDNVFAENVRREIGKLRAPVTQEAAKKGRLDFVFELFPPVPGFDTARFGKLFLEIDEDSGEWRRHPSGASILDNHPDGGVMLAGENGRRFFEEWYAGPGRPIETKVEYGEERTDRNGRPIPRPFRMELRPPQPPVGRVISLSESIDRSPVLVPLDFETRRRIQEAAKPPEAPKPKKEGLEALSENGLRFTHIWSLTMAQKPEHEQREARDFVTDIRTNAALINQLGDLYVPGAVDDRFSEEQIRAILEHVQTFMGAKLSMGNRLRQMIERSRHLYDTGAGLEASLGAFVQNVGRFVARAAIVWGAVFSTFILLFLVGAFGVLLDHEFKVTMWNVIFFVPAVGFAVATLWTKGWTRFLLGNCALVLAMPAVVYLIADWAELKQKPYEFAAALVAAGGFLAMIQLFTFTPIQAVLSFFTRFAVELEKNWLVDKGRILVMFIGIHVEMLVVLLWLQAPWAIRILVVAVTATALGSQMGLTAYDAGVEAKQRTQKTLRLFSFLGSIEFIAMFAAAICMWLGKTREDVWMFVVSSLITQSILMLLGTGFIAFFIIRFVEIDHADRHGTAKEMTNLRWACAAIVALLTIWPWIGPMVNTAHTKAIFTSWFGSSNPTPAVLAPQAPAPASAAPMAPVAVQQPEQHAGGKNNSTIRNIKSKITEDDSRDLRPTAEECEGYSQSTRAYLGCP